MKLKLSILNGKVEEYESLKRSLYDHNDPILSLLQNSDNMDDMLSKTKCVKDEDWCEARRQLRETHHTSKCC